MAPRIIFKHADGGKLTVSALPQGVCSQQIDIVIEDGVIEDVAFTGGCHGNTQAVASLLRGMKATEAVQRLEGIDCNFRGTSCPDQLAQILKQVLNI